MLRTIKPKNARSKRALEAREAKVDEDERTAIFVKGTHTGLVVSNVMKDLMALKRPHAISFSKKNNTVRPFEDVSSLEFWAQKNDAGFFVYGQSTKKKPNGLVLVRMFDGKVLDMCELGVEKYMSMADFKTPKCSPGHKPLMYFASELFTTHPRLIQLKSLLMDLFNAEVIDQLYLSGVQHVIAVSLAPNPASLSSATVDVDDTSSLPRVHLRTYTTRFLASGTRIPRVELTPMGPFIDFTLRRHQAPDPELWKASMKRPKLKKTDVEKGLGKRKKNQEVDEMGDLRGRVHVAKQDFSKLQTRKMKGLRSAGGDDSDDDEGPDTSQPNLKRRKKSV